MLHLQSSVRPQKLLALVAVALLACGGCFQKPPSAPLSIRSARSVQAAPQYRQAVRSFAHRDYRQALSLVNGLLAGPEFQRDPASLSFLRSQQAICRHAVDPHAVTAAASSASPPAVPSFRPRPISQTDCGPRALLLLCPQLGVRTSLNTLRKQAGTTAAGTSLAGLAQAAQSVGLKARGVRLDRQALTQLSDPAVAWVDGDHYVALLSVEGQRATIHDPNQLNEEVLPVTRLLQRSGGVLLTLSH